MLMYTKSSSTKLFAKIPGSIFMVNITKFSGPKISSILPIFFLFSRYIPALKYGIFVSACVSLQTSSDSQSCSTLPHSEMKKNFANQTVGRYAQIQSFSTFTHQPPGLADLHLHVLGLLFPPRKFGWTANISCTQRLVMVPSSSGKPLDWRALTPSKPSSTPAPAETPPAATTSAPAKRAHPDTLRA